MYLIYLSLQNFLELDNMSKLKFCKIKGNILFTISLKSIKTCSICFKYEENNIQLEPLIPVTLEELNY